MAGSKTHPGARLSRLLVAVSLLVTLLPVTALADTVPSCDFNDDGYSDLAIGVPGHGDFNIGAVDVVYGASGRLTQVGNQSFVRTDIGGAEGISWGDAVTCGDFDGDGYSDLAVSGVQAVDVIFGSSTGLSAVGAQNFTVGNSDYSLSSGDFNNDGYDELVIGDPHATIGGAVAAGRVRIAEGGPGGLASGPDWVNWSQDTAGVHGGAEAGDNFGAAVTTGDFDADGYDDLAIGVPEEDLGSIGAAGMINIIYGSSGGLNFLDTARWHQDRPGIKGKAEGSDMFGFSLATGDFDGDGKDDLIIGNPREDTVGTLQNGMVSILYGSSDGISSRDQVFHQATPGIKGTPEQFDLYGMVVAAGDFNGDGYDDAAVGVPWEDIGALTQAGLVNIIYGSASGLTTSDINLYQDAQFVNGASEVGDNFGIALAFGNFDGQPGEDLAIGVDGEDIGDVANAGMVNILYGSVNGGFRDDDSAYRGPLVQPLSAFDRFGSSLSS